MTDDLHTYIEPELEARITALVLGEVSEFDVEELERMIEKQPELQIFRRRMEAMHELLGETVKPEKDEAWQLSGDRRDQLRRTFARQAEPACKASRTVSRAQWRSGIGIAACVVVCLVIFSVMDPLESPKSDFSMLQIISYQAAAESDAESSSKEKSNGRNQKWGLERDESKEMDHLESDLQFDSFASGTESPGKKKMEKARGRSVLLKTDLPKEVIEGTPSPGFMTRAVKKRKPSAPSSSMAKVIASNAVSPASIPVPTMEVSDDSVGFGNASSGKDIKGEPGALTMSAGGDDPFGGGGGGGQLLSRGQRKSDVSKKSEKSNLSLRKKESFFRENESLAANKKFGKKGAFPATPATTTWFEARDMEVAESGGYFAADMDQVEAVGFSKASEKRLDVVGQLSDQRMGGNNYSDHDGSDKNGSKIVGARKLGYLSSVSGGTRSGSLVEVEGEEQAKKPQDVSSPAVVMDTTFRRASLHKGLNGGVLEKKERMARKAEAGEKGLQPTKPAPTSKRKSKRPQPLPEETKTSAQPFSTFSLNVADVSFKLAKVALLEKGQWPNAAKVRTEEFVNAFDYGDPSPRRGESVACVTEQTPHPFLQQRNLIRIGMKTAALGRSTPLRLTVLLDNSGSMEREDREASVLAAIQVLASQLGPQDKITLVGFARQPRLLADRLRGDKAGKLVDIVANTPSEGGTNIEEALRLARKLAKRQHTKGAQDRIVLITDGVANLGNTVPEELSREIEIMRQEGIAFDACGVGAEGLNDDILEALTRKGDGRYYFLNRPEDADSGFAKQLAGALSPAAKNVKVQVVFNSKRVTKYRLLGFEKHRLKKEDFRNDKVDAAEMAAEEAGNAVYQIMVNPDGEGELGEVFVRFLDANTNRMVERSWPLAYESQMKPFDRATPSMQLAATASMLGEKLHGTDAGSVRFQEISNTLGKLRAHYAANERVQDLIRMCEKVK